MARVDMAEDSSNLKQMVRDRRMIQNPAIEKQTEPTLATFQGYPQTDMKSRNS